MCNRYADDGFKRAPCVGKIKLQISLEILLSMSVAMLIALYVFTSFTAAYSSYGKMHSNEISLACDAINLSSKIANQCSYCISLVRNEC